MTKKNVKISKTTTEYWLCFSSTHFADPPPLHNAKNEFQDDLWADRTTLFTVLMIDRKASHPSASSDSPTSSKYAGFSAPLRCHLTLLMGLSVRQWSV